MRDEQFGFRPRHSTSLQLARLVERIIRNVCEKVPRGAVFIDVVKAFNTIDINGLLYNVTLLSFKVLLIPHYLNIPPGLDFEPSLQTTTTSRHGMRAGVAQG